MSTLSEIMRREDEIAVKARRAEREALRLRFFREFRGDKGCQSVSVRREDGAWVLSVGVLDGADSLPTMYENVPVRVYKTNRAYLC